MGSSSSKNGDPLWYGYIEDGKGWTVRPRSEYMKSPDYNPELRRQLKQQKQEAINAQTYGPPSSSYGPPMSQQPNYYPPQPHQQPMGSNAPMGQAPHAYGSRPPPYQQSNDASQWGYLNDGKGWTPPK